MQLAGDAADKVKAARVDCAALRKKAEEVRAKVDGIEIKDRGSFEEACAVALEAKEAQALVKSSDLSGVSAAAHALHSEIANLLKALASGAVEAEDAMKRAISLYYEREMKLHRLREMELHRAKYDLAEEDRRREVEALRGMRRNEEADRLEQQELRVPFIPQPFEIVPVKGVSITPAGYEAVVVDETLVPMEFKTTVVALPKVQAHLEACAFLETIAGVEVRPVFRIAIKAGAKA